MAKVALVFPPQGHFTQPYLSLPSLAAYLRAHGVDDVDADRRQHRGLRPLPVARAPASASLERIGARGRAGGARGATSWASPRWSATSGSPRSSSSARRSPSASRRPRACCARRTSSTTTSATCGPGARSSRRCASSRPSSRRRGSRRTASSCEPRRALAPRSSPRSTTSARTRSSSTSASTRCRACSELDPDLLGISLTFPSQAIPALTLARLVKAWKPGVHITLGGGLMAYVAEKLSQAAGGVGPDRQLRAARGRAAAAAAVRGGRRAGASSGSIENLIWRDALRAACSTTRSREPLDIKTLPTPDFDGLPLDKYFSPELVLPLAITRGCYWGKCVFCTLYTVIGPGYRGRTIAADGGGHAAPEDQVRRAPLLPGDRGPAAEHGQGASRARSSRPGSTSTGGATRASSTTSSTSRSATTWRRPAASASPSATRAPRGACSTRCARASTPTPAWS